MRNQFHLFKWMFWNDYGDSSYPLVLRYVIQSRKFLTYQYKIARNQFYLSFSHFKSTALSCCTKVCPSSEQYSCNQSFPFFFFGFNKTLMAHFCIFILIHSISLKLVFTIMGSLRWTLWKWHPYPYIHHSKYGHIIIC